MESLRQYLKGFVEKRIEYAAIKAARNKRARNLALEIDRLQKLVLSKIPIEDEGLLLQYEEAVSARHVVIYERIYWQSLKDGIRTANKSRKITGM
jgi:hypothetical protein